MFPEESTLVVRSLLSFSVTTGKAAYSTGGQTKAPSIPALVLTFPTPELSKSGAFIDLQHDGQLGYCSGAATPMIKPHAMEPSVSDPFPGGFEAHADEHGVIVSDNARVIGVSTGNDDVATTRLKFRLRNWSARLSKTRTSRSGTGVLARLSRRLFGMESKLLYKRGSAQLDFAETGRSASVRMGLPRRNGLDISSPDQDPSFSSVTVDNEKRSSGSSKSTRASRYAIDLDERHAVFDSAQKNRLLKPGLSRLAMSIGSPWKAWIERLRG
jgi:hypothetical protein